MWKQYLILWKTKKIHFHNSDLDSYIIHYTSYIIHYTLYIKLLQIFIWSILSCTYFPFHYLRNFWKTRFHGWGRLQGCLRLMSRPQCVLLSWWREGFSRLSRPPRDCGLPAKKMHPRKCLLGLAPTKMSTWTCTHENVHLITHENALFLDSDSQKVWLTSSQSSVRSMKTASGPLGFALVTRCGFHRPHLPSGGG